MTISPTDWLAQLPPLAAYGLISGLVFVEGVLVVSPFIPTLGTLLFAGALAHAGVLDLRLVVLCATVGAVLGDALGYYTGLRLGPRLRTSRLARKAPQAWDRASDAVQRRGGPALVVCRFVPLVRSVAPHLAGASGMAYRRMAPYSLAAGALWACAESGVGYLAGASYSRLTGILGVLPVAALVAVALGVLGFVTRRRRNRRAATKDEQCEAEESATK
jgi:membrane protein DedA with SNARE-associated domain